MSNSSKQIKFDHLSKLASQSVNVEWRTCDRNNKDMSSCFDESKKKFLGCSMLRETSQLKKKTKKNRMTDLLSNGLHVKVMIYY